MGTKTIGLDDEAYDLLRAEKREGESFSDTVKRITDEVASDWRHGLGKYEGEDGDAFASAVRRSQQATNEGLSRRQRTVDGFGERDGVAERGGDEERNGHDGAGE